ncbi:hypothetical protein Lfu02_05860 [Longispora fulva]|uniref:Uncharacterized protein n=1 Tax=Longispora fulva TaxID=619741 RepID=A0A8J7GFF2_9ACTN|nr:hypothetical protein [Longispora fulva]MBG6135547.1 hypothetical protein [Longispora fulva]GIG56214.1 hypothetical protein Lfu02_05860 [Longispora fulva]
MNTLMALEPRVAGTDVAEPVVAFADGFNAADRMKCAGCCKQSTRIDIATHSVTQ